MLVVLVQRFQIHSSRPTTTVSVGPPALVILPLIRPSVHVFSSTPPVLSRVAVSSRVASNFVVAPYFPVHGVDVVEQRTLAEAVPAPMNAITAAAATAAVVSNFRCFIDLS